MRALHHLSAALLIASACVPPAYAADFGLPSDLRPTTHDVYVGAYGATSTMRSDYRFSDETFAGNFDGTGYGGGIRAGYDLNIGDWLLGLVADWTFSGQIAEDVSASSVLSLPNLATLRARAGYSAGNVLFYATAGLAAAELEYKIQSNFENLWDQDEAWSMGWTAGGGVDIGLTEGLTLGLEYLYVDVGNPSFDIDAGNLSVEQDIKGIHTLRLGVNYAFRI